MHVVVVIVDRGNADACGNGGLEASAAPTASPPPTLP
jgi:hypothetical protein